MKDVYVALFTGLITVLVLIIKHWKEFIDSIDKIIPPGWKENFYYKLIFFVIKLITQIVLVVFFTIKHYLRILVGWFLRRPLIFMMIVLIIYFSLIVKVFQRDEIVNILIGIYKYFNIITFQHIPNLDPVNIGEINRIIEKKLLNKVTFLDLLWKILSVILPTSITIYIFTYREQKLTSLSSMNKNQTDLLMLHFLLFSLFTIILSRYQVFLIQRANAINGEANLYIINDGLVNVTVTFIFFIISIILAYSSFKSLWRRLNLGAQLKKSIKETKQLILEMSFSSTLFTIRSNDNTYLCRKLLYDSLHTKVESIYQMFTITVNNNMNELFVSNYKSWKITMDYIHNDHRLYYLINEDRYLFFLRRDKQHYISLYRSLLKNHIGLVFLLFEKNKLDEGHDCLLQFFNMGPKGFNYSLQSHDARVLKELKLNYYEIVAEFLQSIYELSMGLYIKNHSSLNLVFKKISGLIDDKLIEKEDLLIVYKALLINAIERNDLKFLTSVLRYVSEFDKFKSENFLGINTNRTELLGIKIDIKKLNNKFLNRNKEQAKPTNFKEITIYLLLQSLIKSAELSHYEVTGLLLKVLVTNYSGEEISDFLCKVEENRVLIDELLGKRPISNKLKYDFDFNKSIYEYNFNKIVLLIYLHQKWSLEYNLRLTESAKRTDFLLPINLSIHLGKCSYKLHLLEKICNDSDRFDLICLKNIDFINKLKNDPFFTKIIL
ncbi:hypothetical protein P9E76_08795 [Schinkia azotoformans]|uniref:Uncharacterized protein n=1 Tax=Schinkia azotoformans LMG 9581 TaxID=1131731 RepID=K6BVW2_SCHAZ|nr:hypothetical protein [Schinkia azotoformans]EKN63050.1 hypothetical protein BAZO_18778 [Schinkia azotoformans LMG 9581]MEC1639113.1 hypothetical protein [Schinkia azotoformans]MEC1945142.1 hypothetical protein [Schinkia azotoformans]